jgi:hypothetical protein
MWFTPEISEGFPVTDEDRLAEVERELRIAEKEFDETFAAIGRHDATRIRLVAIQGQAATRRNTLLKERAELRAKRS